jgi:rare lipoprotein A
MIPARARPFLLAATAAAVCVALSAGCSSSHRSHRVFRGNGSSYVEEGLASWYGHPYHGRPTASGETYDMRKMTAAHRTLPFGTRLRVENLGNGRTATVIVNDRGPFVEGRILDLSEAAAEALDAIGPGVIPVRITVEKVGDGMLADPCWEVQVGAFALEANVTRAQETLRRRGFASRTVPASGGLTRVRVTGVGDHRHAEEAAADLADTFPGAVPVPCAGGW